MSNYLFNKILQNNQYEDFIKFATWMWYKKRYKLFNSALIFLQRPGARYVETEGKWEREYNRFIRPDATPIIILKPFGPVDFLYDLEDTYGEEIPNRMLDAFVMPEMVDIKEHHFHTFLYAIRNVGIFYGEKALGSACGGHAEFLENSMPVTVFDKKPITINTHYAIIVNSSLNSTQKALAILHEVGHILCGHLGQDKDNKYLKVPNRKGENLTKNQKEFEAEKVCEMISQIRGIKYDSKQYLEQYLINGSEPEYSFRIVLDAVDKLLKFIN